MRAPQSVSTIASEKRLNRGCVPRLSASNVREPLAVERVSACQRALAGWLGV